MTLKIGDTQFSNIEPPEIPEKFKTGQLQSNTNAQNESAINFLANNGGANRLDNPNKEKTPADFLREIMAQQPVAVDDQNAAKVRLTMKLDKSPEMATREDYNLAFRRAVYNKAMDGLKLSDEEIKLADQALIDAGLYQTYYNLQGTLDNLKANQQKSENQMPISVGKENIEYARRAGQAILQYQNYKAQQNDLAIESGKTYVNEAIGGFVQPIVNAPVNIVNGLSEPFRAGERGLFGTSYIPQIPKMSVAERSEYWNKDGRMYANKGGEIAATIAFGGIFGGKAIATQTGRNLIGLESAYNLGAGIAGKDITQTDERGNIRQMEWTERGLRIAGGLFGARQTIKTEISTTNSLTNKAVDKLDDIFKNNSFKTQGEFVTPEGFRIKTQSNQFDDFEEIGNTFEMRAKKTLSGAAPEEYVVNALKTEFKASNYQFGKHTFKLDWAGMKHILQRHHPEFWNGSIKKMQSYFEAKIKIGELQEAVSEILKQNRELLIKRGSTGQYQIKGTYNGKEYTLGISNGRIGQLYSPQ